MQEQPGCRLPALPSESSDQTTRKQILRSAVQEQSALHAQPAENLRWGAPKRAVQIGYFFAAYVAQRSLPVEGNFMGRPVAAQLVEAAC